MFREHQKLKGNAVFRFKMMSSEEDMLKKVVDYLLSLVEMSEEASMPVHKTFLNSAYAYIGSQTTKGTSLLGKYSRMDKSHQLEVFENIGDLWSHRGGEEPLPVKQCELVRDLTVFYLNFLTDAATLLHLDTTSINTLRIEFKRRMSSGDEIAPELVSFRRAVATSLEEKPAATRQMAAQRAAEIASREIASLASLIQRRDEAATEQSDKCAQDVFLAERASKTSHAAERILAEATNWTHVKSVVQEIIKQDTEECESSGKALETSITDASATIRRYLRVLQHPMKDNHGTWSWNAALRTEFDLLRLQAIGKANDPDAIGVLHILDAGSHCSSRYKHRWSVIKEAIYAMSPPLEMAILIPPETGSTTQTVYELQATFMEEVCPPKERRVVLEWWPIIDTKGNMIRAYKVRPAVSGARKNSLRQSQSIWDSAQIYQSSHLQDTPRPTTFFGNC
jgi:hypothetical protein